MISRISDRSFRISPRRLGRLAMLAVTFVAALASAFAANNNSQQGNQDQQGNQNQQGDSGPHRFIVVGDSLSAGFQNFSLYDSAQTQGFASLVAQQAGDKLTLPLFSFPGLPGALVTDSSDRIFRSPLPPGIRENFLEQAYNLSVPSFTLANVLSYQINAPLQNPIDALAAEILGGPCAVTSLFPLKVSEVTCATRLAAPDNGGQKTILVSAGNNDALQALLFGAPPTDPGVFEGQYTSLLQQLHSTRANLVVSNIPDVTVLPFMISEAEFEAKCHFVAVGPGGPAGPNDFVVPNIIDPARSSINICDFSNPAHPGGFVRSAALIASAQAAVPAYNATIARVAAAYGAVVVDINGLLTDIAQNGYKVRGQVLTTKFLGGIFSLDGIHPTNTGYAILANKFIDTMNDRLGTKLKDVNVQQIAKDDPLVPKK